MTDSRGPAPGFKRHPDHRIDIGSASGRWQARLGGQLLADSEHALLLDESRHARVVYFPRDDVAEDRLVATDSKTTCPFKGEASYFRRADDEGGEDIAWTYPETFDEVADIAGFVAFYANRVTVTDSSND